MTSPRDPGTGTAALSDPPGGDPDPAEVSRRRQEDALARLSPEAVLLLVAASVYREPVDLGALLTQVGKQDSSAAREPGADRQSAEAAGTGAGAARPRGSGTRTGNGSGSGTTAGNGSGSGTPAVVQARADTRTPATGASAEISTNGPPGLAVLMTECATAGLLTVEPLPVAGRPAPANQPVAVFVAQTAAIELQSYLAKRRRGMEVAAAHRRAADYWLSRVASLQQDRKADVHDLLEARHHLLAADDARQAEAVTQGICDQLHASGEFDSEAALIRDTLIWLPYESPRRAAWVHALGKAAQMQGDNSAARLYRQALDLFSQLGDSTGIASVSQDLDGLSQARWSAPRDSAPRDAAGARSVRGNGDSARREAARARSASADEAGGSEWRDFDLAAPGSEYPARKLSDQADPGHGDPVRLAPDQADPGHSDPLRSAPDQADRSHSDPLRSAPDQADPGHHDPVRSAPDQADPGHRDWAWAGPDAADLGLRDPDRRDSAAAGSNGGGAGSGGPRTAVPDYAAAIAAIPALASPVSIETMKSPGITALPARLAPTGGPVFAGREPLGAYPPIVPGWGERPAEHANPAGWWRWPALVAVLIMTAGLATLVASPSRPPGSRSEAGQLRSEGRLTLSSVTLLRRRAATWVTSQVSRDAIVACDPAMCGALQSLGMPAGCLLVLGPSTPDPLGSDVVVATRAVRNQFGSRLAGVYAPSVLATVGSGPNQIQIRTIAPDGAAAYRTALRADLIDRRQAAAQLLRNPRITFSAASRAQLAAGLADSRLLITLAALATMQPLSVVALGGSAPGESAGVPLYWAEVGSGATPSGHARGRGSATSGFGSGNFTAALLTFLHAQLPPFKPASTKVLRLANGQPVVRIDFAAPSPLGLLSPQGSGIRTAAAPPAHPRLTEKRTAS